MNKIQEAIDLWNRHLADGNEGDLNRAKKLIRSVENKPFYAELNYATENLCRAVLAR